VSDAWRSLKIKQFEHVAAAPSLALLRITGKASRRSGAAEERPALVADDGQNVTRFAALPSPPDDKGVLRAAYSVPAAVLTADTVFSLELKDGHVIALPAPVARATAAPPTPDIAPGPGPSSATSAQADEALRQELADANRRAEDALLEAAAARDEREALHQRAQELEAAVRERQAALDELEVWRGELERRLASMSTELGDATTRLRAAEQELALARGETEETEADGETPVSGLEAEVSAAEPPPPPAAPIGLDELRRRAAARAGEVAARELADASADAPETRL
jgi:hypothetical protein